jgi:hypothetical protein
VVHRILQGRFNDPLEILFPDSIFDGLGFGRDYTVRFFNLFLARNFCRFQLLRNFCRPIFGFAFQTNLSTIGNFTIDL